jgi:predicted phage terminase large subunit-like protein
MVAIAREKRATSAQRALAERARHDFKLFIREAWKMVEPGTPLLWNWHIDAIAEHLMAVSRGEITRLVVNIAPGHMKSTLFSVMWPAWDMIDVPHERWLCASHSLGLAIRDNRNCRTLIESEWYQSCYGDAFSLAPDQNAKGYFENDHRGYRMAVSVGSKGIGKRGSRLLIDDPNDAKASQADIEATKHWFGATWLSRLNDQEHGAMVVVGQRLHEEDLSGHILTNLKGWEHLNLPTEYEPSRKCFTNIKWDEKSVWKGCDPRTKEGELLWPAKFPPAVLAALKASMGALLYSAQHQQSPVPPGGYVFNKGNERLFEISPERDMYILHTPEGNKVVPVAACWEVTTSDVAAKAKEENDYTVFAQWAVTPEHDVLLLDLWRGHWTIPEQKKQARKFYRVWYSQRYRAFYFEDVAYQGAIAQDLLLEGIPCLSFYPQGKGDKVMRAGGASIYQEAGKVYFLKGAPWLPDFQNEIYNFPKAAHDDQVDPFSMVCMIVREPVIDELDEATANAISGYVGY